MWTILSGHRPTTTAVAHKVHRRPHLPIMKGGVLMLPGIATGRLMPLDFGGGTLAEDDIGSVNESCQRSTSIGLL